MRRFEGIVFTDTFNLGEAEGQFAAALPVNSARVERQQGQVIKVIVGNPPYSAGQRSSTDENPNVAYQTLEQRVRDTFAQRSSTTLKNSLYDSYKLALRWASDRIGDEGVIAFVTNGSFIDGNADAGLRACLADEFSHLYVFNLRGNQRTQGERSRQEGGKIFGSGSRTPVAFMVLVRDPAHQGKCQISYKDIGDYLSREKKLQMIRDFGSIAGMSEWATISPDVHDDWLAQRDPLYQVFMPLGSKEAKKKNFSKPRVAARSYSSGIKTSRDAWLYSFDRNGLCHRVQNMIDYYEQRRRAVVLGSLSLEEAGRNDSPDRIRFDREFLLALRRNIRLEFDALKCRLSMYRPFCKQYLYFEPHCINTVYRIPAMFPTPEAPNQVIGVTGRGETVEFSSLITDVIPNLHLVASAQWFPRWRYEAHDPQGPDAWAQIEDTGLDVVPGYRRVDNITDWCLQQFRLRYPALHITKDDIWYYLYGLLHSPDYRKKYKADLSKDLPRIPYAPDFSAFRDSGAELATLHLGYETGPEYDLQVEMKGSGDGWYQLASSPMQWGGTRKDSNRSVLQITSAVTLRGIPEEAHSYVVNGRSPLEWAVDRLLIRQDKESGIVNDPNAWFADDPAALVSHLRRLVYLSVETERIVRGMPSALKG